MTAYTQHPNLTQQRSLQLLNKLLFHHITDLTHITLPNGTHLMSIHDFKQFYKNPTKLIQIALKFTEQLFCHPSCLPHYTNTYSIHYPPRTLLPQFILQNHTIIPNINQQIIQQPIPLH
jgi:hypothetical protein